MEANLFISFLMLNKVKCPIYSRKINDTCIKLLGNLIVIKQNTPPIVGVFCRRHSIIWLRYLKETTEVCM